MALKSPQKPLPAQTDEHGHDAWQQVTDIVGARFFTTTSAQKLDEFRRMVTGAALHGTEPSGPVREVLALLGDRWTTLLLQLLHYGPFRFSVLQRLVAASIRANISRRMLAHKLRALERDGFVSRTVTPSSPPQVEYALTEMGEKLWVLAANLVEWLTSHEAQIQDRRREFAEQGEKQPLW